MYGQSTDALILGVVQDEPTTAGDLVVDLGIPYDTVLVSLRHLADEHQVDVVRRGEDLLVSRAASVRELAT